MGEIPKGWYTDSCYMGYIGKDPQGYIAIHNPGRFVTKGICLYMRFDTESEYIDWWQNNFKGSQAYMNI